MNEYYMLFLDFDGTITHYDVGYEMFKKFTCGATEPLVEEYRQGRLNSRDCLGGECDIWNIASPNIDDVHAFLDGQMLRAGFNKFLDNLNGWHIRPLILSEGFSFYIDRILKSHNLDGMERITNLARFENGRLAPEFPYHKLGCGECSNCKGYHIRRLRPPRSCAIYIGDGHSDLHASEAADIIFARQPLSELLAEAKQGFFPYNDFDDVSDKLEQIIHTGLFTQSNRIDYFRFSERHYDNIRSLWENGDVMRHVGYPDGLQWSQEKFDSFWQTIEEDRNAVRLALEDKTGCFLGEAMIAFPNKDGLCEPDLKLLPEHWGEGLAFEAWQIILRRMWSRWPDVGIQVTPNVENQRAINLYLRLGFEFDGPEGTWQSSDGRSVPVRFRRMIKKGVA